MSIISYCVVTYFRWKLSNFVRYRSHMKYIVPMSAKDLSGNLWRYGSYHVHVFLRFSALVSHTQNRPASLVLLILILTWFLALGTYEVTKSGTTFNPKKYLEKNLATKPISFFLQIMNVQSDDVRNIWIGGSSYRGDNSFTKLFIQKILNKEG